MNKNKIWSALVLSLGFLVLIFDSRTAFNGALSGIEICIKTVIPSLFPFFVLSILLTRALSGADLKLLNHIGRFLRFPQGAEAVLIPAFLGGYPAGAQSVVSACGSRQLTHSNAKKMLCFCNNAGPAFLFGMLTPVFPDTRIPWVLWGIHICSAVLTSRCTNLTQQSECNAKQNQATESDFMYASVKAMGIVCGWIILFRMILIFMQHWFLWFFPVEIQVFLSGIMELSNGCLMLSQIRNISLRIIVASGMLSFGGFCVAMQTKSVAGDLFGPEYIKGKILQAAISTLLSASFAYPWSAIPAVFLVVLLISLIRTRKNSSIPEASVI